MPRLPELSYRLAHHFPEGLPFIVPFYNKLTNAGFDIDERKLKPVLRRNGFRIVTDYSRDRNGASVTFRLYRQTEPITTLDLSELLGRIRHVRSVRDYAAVDRLVDDVVHRLELATPSPH